MKLPEVLKQGILTENWSLICQVYMQITGEHIEPPPKKLYIPTEEELLKDMDINLGDSGITGPINIQPDSGDLFVQPVVETIHNPTDSFIASAKQQGAHPQPTVEGRRVARTESMDTRPKKNRFADDKTLETKDLVENNPQLGKMYQTPKPRGQREQSAYIDVECSVCHKRQVIATALSFGYSTDPDDNRYKCNDCTTKLVANYRRD